MGIRIYWSTSERFYCEIWGFGPGSVGGLGVRHPCQSQTARLNKLVVPINPLDGVSEDACLGNYARLSPHIYTDPLSSPCASPVSGHRNSLITLHCYTLNFRPLSATCFAIPSVSRDSCLNRIFSRRMPFLSPYLAPGSTKKPQLVT